MTTQDKIRIIEKLVAHYKAMETAQESLNQVLGVQCDAPGLNPFWAAFDGYVAAVALAVGDETTPDWLGWYIWENKCGKRAMQAGYSGKLRRIRTVPELVRLIERKSAPCPAT